MMTTRTLAALALSLGLALPAAAAEFPPPPAPPDDAARRMAAGAGRGTGRAASTGARVGGTGTSARAGPTYAGIALRHRAELALNPQQVQTLEKLAMDTPAPPSSVVRIFRSPRSIS